MVTETEPYISGVEVSVWDKQTVYITLHIYWSQGGVEIGPDTKYE